MEKPQYSAVAAETPYAQIHPYVWRPGLRRIPWLALLALFIVLLCVPASAAIIIISNGRVADWRVQPSVLLGIISGVANSALLYALWKGVDISWWRAALHGTTLEQLNRIWSSGTSVRSALFSIVHVKRIGIASILSSIAAIVVSPLLQKASHARLLDVAQDVEMQVYLPTKFPTGFAGWAWDSNPPLPGNTLLNPDFLEVIQTWYTGTPILTLNTTGFFCDGTCEGTVQGAGISQTCSSSYTMVDLTEVTTSGFPAFSTSFDRFEDSNGVTNLEVTSRYISTVDDTCSATYITEVCDITPGINTYPLLYHNNTMMKNPNISETLVESYTTDDDLTTAPFESPVGLLSGLHWFADTYLASNSNLIHGTDPNGKDMYIEIPSGFLSSQYVNLTDSFTPGTLGCQFEWKSPTVFITSSLNLVAFTAAIMSGWAQNENDLQTFTAVQTQPMVVYHSEYVFLAIALAVLLAAFLAVSSTIYGFWQLGHKTSLSPLETAHALQAPVLAEGGSGASSGKLRALLKEVGKKEVKYGVLGFSNADGIGVEKLGIAPPYMLVRHLK